MAPDRSYDLLKRLLIQLGSAQRPFTLRPFHFTTCTLRLRKHSPEKTPPRAFPFHKPVTHPIVCDFSITGIGRYKSSVIIIVSLRGFKTQHPCHGLHGMNPMI